jgi:hypothetical protein
LTEEGRLFDEARDGAEDGSEGVAEAAPVERTPSPSSDPSGGAKSNDAMPDEPPRDPPSPQRRDLRKILGTAALFLVAFVGGAAVGLMVHRSDGGSSDSARASASFVEPAGGGADDDVSSGGDLAASTDATPAAGANEPPTGLLRSTRSPSPTQSLQPVVKPFDTSGAWYSVQSSPSPTEEGAALQSNSTATSSPTDESTTFQLNGTVIPLQNGTTAPTGNNDTSTSSIIATQSTNDPTPTPQTIDVSSWIYAFNSSLHPTMMMTTTPPSSATMKPTTTTTSTELDDVTSNSTTTTTTTESSINLDHWVDTFNAIAEAGGAAPCLTDEACDAQRQSMGFVYYEVGD